VKTPAEDKPEEAEEEAVDEPRETVIKPVVEEKPATDTPPLPVATEASQNRPAFKDIVTTHMVIPEQNRMTAKIMTSTTTLFTTCWMSWCTGTPACRGATWTVARTLLGPIYFHYISVYIQNKTDNWSCLSHEPSRVFL
jgi:hypothetical protein